MFTSAYIAAWGGVLPPSGYTCKATHLKALNIAILAYICAGF